MKFIKNLTNIIPNSPYSWKMTSQKRRDELIDELVKQRQVIMKLDLPSLIEGELYTIEDGNDSQTFEALRTIRKVLIEKFNMLKTEKN